MKKILTIAAALSLAAVFTACDDSSSDSSKDVISCDTDITMAGESILHYCAESDASAADAQEMKASCVSESGMKMTVGTGCPSGAANKCEVTVDGTTGTLYFYGEGMDKVDCSDLTAMMTGDDEE